MIKVKVSDEFCIKVINFQRVNKYQEMLFCFLFLLFDDTYLSIKWNQNEDLIEITILKSFPCGLYPR
jgi:hypothetical protein